jgi:hypothetical protein
VGADDRLPDSPNAKRQDWRVGRPYLSLPRLQRPCHTPPCRVRPPRRLSLSGAVWTNENAQPMGIGWAFLKEELSRQSGTFWQTWQRPTLPRLETKYHRRWGVSRPSSEWDRVQPPRHSHQVGKNVSDFWSSVLDEHCLMRATKPIELLVPVSYTPCSASTPGLSTWWSSTALRENWFRGGFPA